MTGRTARKFRCRANLSFCGQLLADFRLIVGRFPVHVKNVLFRLPQGLLRIFVAIQTPFHQQGRGLKHQRHLIDRAVARRAADAFIDVNAVVEIDKIGKPVDFHPLDRLIGAIAFANGFEVRSVGIQNGMAVHAGLRRGDARDGGSLNRGVTIAAIEPVVSNVMFMAELHGLRARNVLVRGIRRARQPQYADEPQTDQKNSREQAESGNEICASMKNLGHVSVALFCEGPSREGAEAQRLRVVMAGKCVPGA